MNVWCWRSRGVWSVFTIKHGSVSNIYRIKGGEKNVSACWRSAGAEHGMKACSAHACSDTAGSDNELWKSNLKLKIFHWIEICFHCDALKSSIRAYWGVFPLMVQQQQQLMKLSKMLNEKLVKAQTNPNALQVWGHTRQILTANSLSSAIWQESFVFLSHHECFSPRSSQF